MEFAGYKILDKNFEFKPMNISFNELITDLDVSAEESDKGYIIPGLIDVHSHGAVGQDFMNVTDFESYLYFMYSKGITTFYPTTVSATLTDLLTTVSMYKDLHEISGINIEGPFISEEYKGAHAKETLCEAQIEWLYKLQEASGNKIKIITVAPEIGQNMEFIHKASKIGIHVSIGHTSCDYTTAVSAFESGADRVTHLFNAMPPLHHRKSGLIGAAFDKDVFVEIIADGIHVAPEVVRLAYKAIGSDRLMLISDSMSATGLSDGKYKLGSLDVEVKDKIAYTVINGALAGSTNTIYDMVLSAIKIGIPKEEAVKMATFTPAKSVCETEIGVLEIGKRADLVVLDNDFSVLKTIKNGQIVYSVD